MMNILFIAQLLFLLFRCNYADVVLVDPTNVNADSSNCGSSNVPCKTISDGINAATSNSIILLTPHVYFGAGNENITLRQSTFTNVTILGNGNTEDVMIQCSLANPAFIIIGNTLINHIMNITISNCHTALDKHPESENGGAINVRNLNETFTLENMLFKNNTALNSGGAVYATMSNSVIVVNCVFRNNYAVVRGGALSITFTNATVKQSIFEFNIANGTSSFTTNDVTYETGGRGGALYSLSSSLYVGYARFTNNSAVRSGGAVYVEDMRNTHFDYAVFLSNLATGGEGNCPADASCEVRGGALYGNNGNLVFNSVTFQDNEASTPNIDQVQFLIIPVNLLFDYFLL